MTKEFCFVVENEHLQEDDIRSFFHEKDVVDRIPKEFSMWDVLVKCGIFQSKSQARKDVKWKDQSEIPNGWNEFVVGKLKHKIYILKCS